MESNNSNPQYAEFEAAINPSIIKIMMNLQAEYNLPIEIICGQHLQELQMVKLRAPGFDDTTLRWFVNTAVNLELLRSGGTSIETENDDEL